MSEPVTVEGKTVTLRPSYVSNKEPFLYYAACDSQRNILGVYSVTEPPISDNFIRISAEDYDKYLSNPYAKIDAAGNFVLLQPPEVPLATQAQNALNNVTINLYQEYGVLNQPTPTVWVDYITKLQNIANGTDTTSTTLPTPPTENS